MAGNDVGRETAVRTGATGGRVRLSSLRRRSLLMLIGATIVAAFAMAGRGSTDVICDRTFLPLPGHGTTAATGHRPASRVDPKACAFPQAVRQTTPLERVTLRR